MNKLENLKKRILYRGSYRGTKELDLLLSSFVKNHINTLNEDELHELDDFLNLDDNQILDFYQRKNFGKNIKKNKVSNLFLKFKM